MADTGSGGQPEGCCEPFEALELEAADARRRTFGGIVDPVVHFEMPFEDRQRAAAFYTSVFGWSTQLLGEEMGHYVLVTTATSDVKPGAPAGAINGGLFRRNPDRPGQHPSIVIAVRSIRESMRKVVQAGGTVHGDPMEITGIGQYVAFTDTEGNRCSMLQPSI